MRYSQLFGKTRSQAPADADSVNARLLTQAGFIDKVAAGIYNFLPLGFRVLQKINQIIREEMDAVGGQELLMPALHPIEIWQATGRDRTMVDILYRTKGAGDKNFVFGPSHEETVTPLAKKYIKSYKDLPLIVYQIQTKFRNEPRAKSGVLRGREFGMKDMYSFHRDEKDLDDYYEKVKEAYLRVYRRSGLNAYVMEASGGAFSDKFSHEFAVKTPAGEDTMIFCPKCEIAQNLEIAEGKVVEPGHEEDELPLKKVKVKRGPSVEANAKAHDVPPWKILKSVVYMIEDLGLLGVLIRGDLNVNEYKLEKYLKKRLRSASPEELERHFLAQGYISPVGMEKTKKGGSPLPFISDHSIRNVKNFVTGANESGVDYVNANVGRDFVVKEFTDLVEVRGGFRCTKCGGELQEEKAIEAGNIFKLGTKFSKDFDVSYLDEKGRRQITVMGCYGIGNTRLVGTIVEASHDEKGIIWPKSVAPYLVHLIHLGKEENVKSAAEKLYKELNGAGVEVLYDDREESAGVKFNDADLIGIPLRLLVSGRTFEKNSVEWKLREEKEGKLVALSDVVKEVRDFQKK